MKKLVSAILVSSMLMATVAGCGSSAPETNGNATSAPSSTVAQDGGEVTIWVEKSFSDIANQLIQERFDRFTAETGITVNAEFVAATDLMAKQNAAIEAKAVPDITSGGPYKTLSYYPNNPYMDVTDLVEKINSQHKMFAATKDGSKIEGVNYFVPFYNASSMMFIRKDLFDAKGIEIPKTWEELFEAAVKVSDPENGIYGLGIGCGPTDEDSENTFRMMMWSAGGSLMDKDGNVVANTDPALRKMVEKYKELFDAQAIPPSAPSWDPGGNNKSYLMGESAIVVNIPTLYNAMKSDENYKDLLANTVVISPPAGSAEHTVFANPMGWSIMNGCKNEDNARKLIEYLYDSEWYTQYMESITPVFAPIFEDFRENPIWADGINKAIIDYAENATGYYGYPAQTTSGRAAASKNYFSFPVARMLNSIVTGSETVDSAIAQIDKELSEAVVNAK